MSSIETSALHRFEEMQVNPESKLQREMTKAMTRTVQGFLKKFPTFRETYPELFEESSDHLKDIHSQLKSQMRDNLKREQAELCSEENLSTLLGSLEVIVEDQKGNMGQLSWRPSGNPSEDLRDHLHQLKLKHKKCLEFIAQTLVLQNDSIEKTVQERHQEIMSMKGNIDQLNGEIKNHFEDINDIRSLAPLENQMSSFLHTKWGK